MVEIRQRIHLVDLATSNSLRLELPFINELFFLQFRMMCELFSLACLVAHGDIAKNARFKKAWQADAIMNGLEALHSEFYPVAIRLQRKKDGISNFEPIDPQPLPKKELLKLYRSCGERLHRGNIRKLLSKKHPVQRNHPEITRIAQRFRDLMSSHYTMLYGYNQVIVCQSVAVGSSETVNVYLSEGRRLVPPPFIE